MQHMGNLEVDLELVDRSIGFGLLAVRVGDYVKYIRNYLFFCGFGRKRPARRLRSLHVGQVDVHVGQVQDLSVQKLNLKNNY